MTPITSAILPIKDRPGYTNYSHPTFGSAFALSIAEVSKNHSGLLMVLLPDAAMIFALKREIEYFMENSTDAPPVITFPDWEKKEKRTHRNCSYGS